LKGTAVTLLGSDGVVQLRAHSGNTPSSPQMSLVSTNASPSRPCGADVEELPPESRIDRRQEGELTFYQLELRRVLIDERHLEVREPHRQRESRAASRGNQQGSPDAQAPDEVAFDGRVLANDGELDGIRVHLVEVKVLLHLG